MRRILPLLFLAGVTLCGQTADHVKWSLTGPKTAAPGSRILAKLTAAIDPGWHLYSLTTPQPGPIATKIRLRDDGGNFESIRIFQPPPIRKFDPNFNRDTETYEESAIFYLEATLKPSSKEGSLELSALPRYQVCSSTVCIPPVTRSASSLLLVDKTATIGDTAIPAGYVEARLTPKAAIDPPQESPWMFLLTAFGFGLAAIFTPCVFPMIPITMSYFFNQQSTRPASRASGLAQATLFCGGIIVLFSALGTLATVVLGPFGVVKLGSNPWVNSLIAIIFFVFGLSLLGAFEITIPSVVLTKLDSASRGGGVVGTLLMGLTFSLASFACVGPFVGTLLAASVTGGRWRPLLGMAVFSAGLAFPFFLLALFPSYLKKLPRSGGWLARVKVVMGFIILAAALKYLASIDQVLQWNFLTRERFLSAWIVLFAMAGLYLLGYVRLEGVSKEEPVGLGRLFAGMALVIFSISLLPGMFGGRLGEIEAFVPPPAAGVGPGSGDSQLVWLKNDLDGAMSRARAEGKRVLVNFTGYACTNCHWMKQNMFTRPPIAGALKNMVLVDLYTDGEDAQSQANQRIEESRFHTIAIPYYVLYDPASAGGEPRVVAEFPGLTRNEQEYLGFLNTSIPPAAETPVSAATAGGTPALAGVKSLDGGTFDLKPLAGKVVVANFWATWCVPCRKEIPEFNGLQGSLGNRGVQVVGISLDEDGAEVVKPFLEKNRMDYLVALASEDTKTSYKLDQLPVTVVFDRKGQIADRFEGLTEPAKIREAVEKVL